MRKILLLLIASVIFFGCSNSGRKSSGPMKPAASMHAEGYGLRPENTDLESMTMKALLDAKKYDYLIKKYSKKKELKDFELSIIGEAYYFMRDDKNAIKFFDKAIEAGMNKPHTYYYRAGSYSELGKFEKSLDSYRKVLELNPGDTQVYYNMSQVYMSMNLPDSAIAIGNKVLKLHSEDMAFPPYFYSIIPQAYYLSGDVDKALKKYDEIAPMISADKNDRAIFLQYKSSLLVSEKQDTLGAIKVLTDFIKDNPKSYLSYSVVIRFLNENKKYDKADSLCKVLKKFYDDGVLEKEISPDYDAIAYEQIFLDKGCKILTWRVLKDPEKFADPIFYAELYDSYGKMIRRIQTEKSIAFGNEEASHILGEYLVNGHHSFPYGWNTNDIPYESFRELAVAILKSGD